MSLWQYLNYSVLPNKEKDYGKRAETVRHLCRKDGEVDTAVNGYLEGLRDINNFNSGVVEAWQQYLEPLDIAATYLGAGLSEKQLARKEYDSERKYTVKPFCFFVPLEHEGTQIDYIEKKAIDNQPDDMLDKLITEQENDELYKRFEGREREVADLLCQFETQTYIQQKLGLTKAQLVTIIKRIGKKLRPVHVEPAMTKTCRSCGVKKDITEFHVDKRNKDNRHCYCKLCVSSRKKTGKRSA